MKRGVPYFGNPNTGDPSPLAEIYVQESQPAILQIACVLFRLVIRVSRDQFHLFSRRARTLSSSSLAKPKRGN